MNAPEWLLLALACALTLWDRLRLARLIAGMVTLLALATAGWFLFFDGLALALRAGGH